ncbi:uncharacterized [Tachysurus ichikawai]
MRPTVSKINKKVVVNCGEGIPPLHYDIRPSSPAVTLNENDYFVLLFKVTDWSRGAKPGRHKAVRSARAVQACKRNQMNIFKK